MAASKIIVLLLAVTLPCFCHESSTKGPINNSTSHVTEGDPKTATEKPQKFAKQMMPEPLSNSPPVLSGHDHQSAANYGQNPDRPLSQGGVRQDQQRDSNPHERQGRRLSLFDQNADQPSHGDGRQGSAAEAELNPNPYYERSAVSMGQASQGRRRDPYGDPSDRETYRPYSFNYIAETDEARVSHQQAADHSGRVSGSYSMVIGDGRKRVVDFTADEKGFKAQVDTNEPGTSSAESPADTVFYTSSSRPGNQGFPGSNRMQPQPNQISPGRDAYRTDGRTPTNIIPGSFPSSDRRTAGPQSNRRQPGFQRGREDGSETRLFTDDVNQPRRGQDPTLTNLHDRHSQQNSISSQPTRSRTPSSTRPNVSGRNNLPNMPAFTDRPIRDQSFPRTNVDSRQMDPRQPNSFSPELNTIPQVDGIRRPIRPSGGNDPSYYGWYNSGANSEANSGPSGGQVPNFEAQGLPTRATHPRGQDDLGYKPSTIPSGRSRSERPQSFADPEFNSGVNPQTRPNMQNPADRSQSLPLLPPQMTSNQVPGRSQNYPRQPMMRPNEDQESPLSYPGQNSMRSPQDSGIPLSHPRQSSLRPNRNPERPSPYPFEPSFRSSENEENLQPPQDSFQNRNALRPRQPSFGLNENVGHSNSYAGQHPARSNQDPSQFSPYPDQPSTRSDQPSMRSDQPSMRSDQPSMRSPAHPNSPSMRSDQVSGRSPIYPNQPSIRNGRTPENSMSYPGQPDIGKNEPSYSGWFNPPGESISQDSEASYDAQRRPLTRNSQPGDNIVPEYQDPSARDKRMRSERPSTSPASRQNSGNAFQNKPNMPNLGDRPQTYPMQPSVRFNQDPENSQLYPGSPSVRTDQGQRRSQFHSTERPLRSNENPEERSNLYPSQPSVRTTQDVGRSQQYPRQPSVRANENPESIQSYPGQPPMRFDQDTERRSPYPQQPFSRSNENAENSRQTSEFPLTRSNMDTGRSQTYPGQPASRSAEVPESNRRPQYSLPLPLPRNADGSNLGDQDNIERRQMPFNHPRASSTLPRSQPGEYGSSQGLPDVQGKIPREGRNRPENNLISGAIPAHYSNYGTYWYYGH